METIVLPKWLDNYIFNELGAKYCRSHCNMTVIDWDKSDVLNYLGTYFPRSYAESYSIFKIYILENKACYENMEEISIFDFGCGAGGEIIGLITALEENLNLLRKVRIIALDGNHHALRLYERIISQLKLKSSIEISSRIFPNVIDDFYDLSVLDTVLGNEKFDIIISFKAICEFVSKNCFETHNAYEHIANVLLPKLYENGALVLVDVTSYNNVSEEWLPKMMDNGLKKVECCIVGKNPDFNQTYTVTHSRKVCDTSKVAWRIIKK
ncbi:MAG: hypothetical protein RR061_08815 [Muribaculaceae bacterium]|uniref:class I SAM-dependent methyltransferase n=1 Tax=Chryseobacterium sp. TaxID=1871047 RepID=UPI002FCB2923